MVENEKLNPKRGQQVTQAEVARKAGVSRSVVSYVINDGPRSVSPETRERVLKAIDELDYRPNKHAQSLMRQQENAAAEKYFGVVLANVAMFRRPYYGSILASIHEHAYGQNGHIRFVRVFRDLQNPILFNELIHPEEVSGLIFLGVDQVLASEEDHLLLDKMLARIDNAVTVEWQWNGAPSILFDRQEAGYKAARHLIELGHVRLGYVGQSDKRLMGFQQALWEVGIPLDTQFVLSDADDAPLGFDRCMRVMERSQQQPTAFVAGSDEVAFGVLKALHALHLQVPDQVALVSIDNIDLSLFVTPALTTVHVPKEDMGLYAVQVLMDYSTRRGILPASIMLPTTLVIRESCGANR